MCSSDLLALPDAAEMQAIEEELAKNEEEMAAQHALLEKLDSERVEHEELRRQAQETLRNQERELSATDAKLITLQRIQKHSDDNGKVDAWLDHHGLAGLPRLWQRLNVSEGWETAVESVLRDRLHSLEVEAPDILSRLIEDPPPSRVLIHVPTDNAAVGDASTATSNGRIPLFSLVQT